MALGFSTNQVIVRCSQEPLQKLGEDYNVTRIFASVKNESGTGTATGTHKQKQLAGIYMHKNLPYIYFSSESVPYKEVAFIYITSICSPMKFPKNAMNQRCLYQFLVAKVRSGIRYMKHLKDFRQTCFGRPDGSPANNFTKGSK